MNHTYRLVWNDIINAFVAVSELTKGRGKRTSLPSPPSGRGAGGEGSTLIDLNTSLRLTLMAAATAAATLAQAADPLPTTALPTGAQLAAGLASVAQTGTRMDITQTSDRAILNWQSFNIGQSAHVNFNQPSVSAVTLNRVVGGDPSQILGRMTANGQVFLSNPNGIYFGKSAQIDVAGLVATTHNIRDQDFMAGRNDFTIPGNPGASVINEGEIRIADTGIAAFVAPSVANRGIIAAKLGKIQLASANGFTLDFNGDDLLTFMVDDKVAQTALDQNGQPLNSFVESSGRIEAVGGYVWLTAKAAEGAVHSAINHSGVIEATTVETHQGQIILHAGEASLQVSGTLDASAAKSGDGGFVETSGAHVTISPEAKITTKAKLGKTGTWLIDPNDYTIAESGGNITGTQLSTQLINNNVVIQTATMGTPGGTGTIYVDAPINWSSGNSLDFQAEGSVLISANIQGNGQLGVSAHANLFVNPGVSVSARHIEYVADNIVLQGRTDAVTNSIYLRPYSHIPVVISNSHVAGALNISPNEIATLHATQGGGNIGIGCSGCGNTPLTVSISLNGDLVDAGDLHLIGTSVTVNQPITFGPNQAGLVFESGSGGVQLNAPIATRNTLHFYLHDGGGVNQSYNAPVSANRLAAEGDGHLTLDDAADGNIIDLVAADVTGSFWVINNYQSLTVGSFDGINGVTAGNIGLYTGGDLIVNEPLLATGTGLISTLTTTIDSLCTLGPCVRPHIEVGANGRFVNNVGGDVISVQPGKYWAIFADNPITTVLNGITPNATSYDAELIHGDVLLSANRVFYFKREPDSLVLVDLCITDPVACKDPVINTGTIDDLKNEDELLILGGMSGDSVPGESGSIPINAHINGAPESVADAFNRADPMVGLAQYLASKNTEANISAIIITVSSVFFDEASRNTLAKFLGMKYVDIMKGVYTDLINKKLTDPLTFAKLTKEASKGLLFDTLFGALADEVKTRYQIDGIWEAAGIDVATSAIKNAALSSNTGPGFVLAFEIGFTSDMAGLAANQTLKAFNTYIEIGGAEDKMNAAALALALQSKSAKERADGIFHNLAGKKGVVPDDELAKLRNKAKALDEIGNKGLDAMATGLLAYYGDKGKSLFLTNPYPLSSNNDVKAVVATALEIGSMLKNGGSPELYSFTGGKYQTTDIGKLVYKLLDDVSFTAWSNDDNRTKAERFVMLREFLEATGINLSLEYYDGIRSSDAGSATLILNNLSKYM